MNEEQQKLDYLMDNISTIECVMFMNKINYMEIVYFLATNVKLEDLNEEYREFNTDRLKDINSLVDKTERRGAIKELLIHTSYFCNNVIECSSLREESLYAKEALKYIEKILILINEKEKTLYYKINGGKFNGREKR